MNIILGGTGNVGLSVAKSLLRQHQPVTIVTRNKSNAKFLEDAGAQVAEVNIREVQRLKEVLKAGTRAFLLNPPASPSGDTDKEERENIDSILAALEGIELEKVVLASTYGARPGEKCGDLTVLYEFEQRLSALGIPVAINRGAYYFTNWLGMLEMMKSSGKLPSFFPSNLELPMVSPEDLGEVAATRLISPVTDSGVRYVEGPERYTALNVAEAFSESLNIPIDVEVVPVDFLEKTFLSFGFSEAAAQSYACMTKVVIDKGIETPSDPIKGKISLQQYIQDKVG